MEESARSRKVIIGGITSAVARALVRALQSAGSEVAGFARDEDRLHELREACPGVRTVVADACDPEEVEAAFDSLCAHWDTPPTGYAHCIGSVFLRPAHLTSNEEWREVLRTNLDSAFFGLRSAVDRMRRVKHGSIVLVSSVAVQTGLANHEAIAAAKGGVEGLVRSAAASYASLGIRVNAVAPGLVESAATAQLLGSPGARAVSERMHPLGRIGRPEDVAGLMEWMLSDAASWVTGQVWGVDGGMGSLLPKPRA